MNVETQSAYISLANNFYITRLSGKELTELNIIGALLRSAPDYRPDYFRRLRNALAFDQRVRGQFWIAQEINRTLNPVTVLNLPIKAKQPRAKKLSDNDFSALVNALSSQNFVAEAAALLLIYHTGARPCELSGISITGQQIHIPGAKNSHDGLRGADRTLESEQQLCDTVANTLTVFKSQSRSLDAIRMTIHSVAVGLFGKRKVPSMYTLRHQFGANLKESGMSRIEMAYVMGHQATDSINRYGDKRQGRAEAVKVKPVVGADLSKIRDTQAVHAQKRHRVPASKQSLLA
ncbi:site-specific integrase [Pseudomonas sp. TMP25]|uniref:site-specific integrase n=1 Tax=Pseudomonas sp. TMP25 TaxID=3136561 RepID=UPI0031013ED8